MPICAECKSFFAVPEGADDYAINKGDCVLEEKDDKGKYWLSKPVMGTTDSNKCARFNQRF
jgi:hypothetical protein